ncbi:MAG: hypothetical protein K2O89_03300 [Clostridia bacterium]|nr:hypothetical protein [Clostridia bacterium]
MPKIKIRFNKKKIFRSLLFSLCFAVIIAVPIMATVKKNGNATTSEMSVLTLWQIDGFEGGKGSRATYLQNLADEFSKDSGCYITVNSLSADAARLNLNRGNIPDMISYGAGMYGIESYIRGNNKPYYNWCNGGYCFLSLDTSADFKDINTENLIINEGNGNLSGAAALLCGVNGADFAKPTAAYVKLINGDYKYLLGTQRDIFRLRTRGVAYSIKPVTEFNDLYQNISVTCTETKKTVLAERFISFLLNNKDGVTALGLMCEGESLYDDDLHLLEGLTYECRLTLPISESTKNEINQSIINCDIKKLKNLLN